MKPQIAIFYIFQNFGSSILKEDRLIHILADYGLFRLNQNGKTIIKQLIKNNIFYDLILTPKKDSRQKLIDTFVSYSKTNPDEIETIVRVFRKGFRAYKMVKKLCAENFKIDESCHEDEFGFIYNSDYSILLGCNGNKGFNTPRTIKEECVFIAEGALLDFLGTLTIPESIIYIEKNALPINQCKICNNSPYFLYINGLLMTADRKRLLKCYSDNTIVHIPKDIISFDNEAFPTNGHECWGQWAYSLTPPYFIRLRHCPKCNLENISAKIILPSYELKNKLIKNNINPQNIIIGDVYVDEWGVIYSYDKKILLCYPQELSLDSYSIIDECEIIANDAFTYQAVGGPPPEPYVDDNGNYVFLDALDVSGNQLQFLKLPSNLKKIGQDAFLGLVNLIAVVINKQSENKILPLINDYTDINDTRKRLRVIYE